MISCSSGVIDKHFELQSGDTDEDTELLYIDNEGLRWTVIDGWVYAYKRCGSALFVKQHPLDTKGSVNKNITKYYIVNLDNNYSDEHSKLHDTSIEYFNSQLPASCSEADFIEP